MVPVALTIAGSDSSGGAGIQADLKTFAAFGVYGASVITALTAQNTSGVRAIVAVDPAFVAAQYDAVADDLPLGAAKTGMLWRAAVIEVVAERLKSRPVPYLVVDPVSVATSGDPLLEEAGARLIATRLLPLATLVTPNLGEAEVLTGRRVADRAGMAEAARALVKMGARAALVKGGHLNAGEALDVLFDGKSVTELWAPRAPLGPLHGAGCTLSAAITAMLARGFELGEAVARAKDYVTRALVSAPALGAGARALNHLVPGDPEEQE